MDDTMACVVREMLGYGAEAILIIGGASLVVGGLVWLTIRIGDAVLERRDRQRRRQVRRALAASERQALSEWARRAG